MILILAKNWRRDIQFGFTAFISLLYSYIMGGTESDHKLFDK